MGIDFCSRAFVVLTVLRKTLASPDRPPDISAVGTSYVGVRPRENRRTGYYIWGKPASRLNSCAAFCLFTLPCCPDAGNNDGGQLGYEDTVARGSNTSEMGDFLPFVDLGRDQKAVSVAAGFFHTCALLYTGDIKCWGEIPMDQ